MLELQGKESEAISEKGVLAGYGVDIPEIEHVEMTTSTDEETHPDSNNSNRTGKISNFSNASARLHFKGEAQSVLLLSTGKPQLRFPGAATDGIRSPDSTPLPAKPPPVKTVGQLGAQNFVNSFKRGVKKSNRSSYTTHVGSSKRKRYPDRIGFSYHSKPPRWLIMPAPHDDSEKPNHALQWVFDSGPSCGSSELSHSELYEIGYKWLRDAYEAPTFRDNMISEIRTGPFALKVADVENPLPPLPPPPDTRPASESATGNNVDDARGNKRSSFWKRPGPASERESMSPESDGYYTTYSNSSNTNYPDGKSLYSRYSSSSDLESQRSRTMAPRFALDGAADDGPPTQIGDGLAGLADRDTAVSTPFTSRENKPRADQTGSAEPGQCPTVSCGTTSPQTVPSHPTTRELSGESTSTATAHGVVYRLNPDITDLGDDTNSMPQASDPWAPWEVLAQIQQERNHDKLFPQLITRRMPTWTGCFVKDDIRTQIPLSPPPVSPGALATSSATERED